MRAPRPRRRAPHSSRRLLRHFHAACFYKAVAAAITKHCRCRFLLVASTFSASARTVSRLGRRPRRRATGRLLQRPPVIERRRFPRRYFSRVKQLRVPPRHRAPAEFAHHARRYAHTRTSAIRRSYYAAMPFRLRLFMMRIIFAPCAHHRHLILTRSHSQRRRGAIEPRQLSADDFRQPLNVLPAPSATRFRRRRHFSQRGGSARARLLHAHTGYHADVDQAPSVVT